MFYEIPLSFGTLLRGQRLLQQPSLEESIRQHATILLLSGKGDWRFDPAFGTELWEVDFETDPEIRRRLQNLEYAIRVLLKKYEPRLLHPEVRITPENRILAFFDTGGGSNTFSQKRLSIFIEGELNSDGRRVQLEPIDLSYRPC